MNNASATTGNARERILDAAFHLFMDRGIEGATTREIAAEAAVNEVTVFRHFGTKDGLVRAVIEQFIAAIALPRLDQAELTGDLAEDLYRLTKLLIAFHEEQADFFRFVFANMVHHPEHVAFFNRLHGHMLGWWEDFFAPHCKRLDLDPFALSMHYISPIVMRSIRKAFLGDALIEEERFARTHANLVARALRPGTAEETP